MSVIKECIYIDWLNCSIFTQFMQIATTLALGAQLVAMKHRLLQVLVLMEVKVQVFLM